MLASGPAELWIATNEKTGDRVWLRCWTDSGTGTTAPALWENLSTATAALRGLVHPGISLVSATGVADEIHYAVEPYLRDARTFAPDAPGAGSALRGIIETLAYAQQLGITHGNLHPGNVLITPDGQTHIRGFGIPRDLSPIDTNYQSPQVRSGQTPDRYDDNFALGALMFHTLTGKPWHPDVKPDLPLPEHLDAMIRLLLSDSPVDRRLDLHDVATAVAKHINPESSGIEAVQFSRAASAPDSRGASPSRGSATVRQTRSISFNQLAQGGLAILVFAVLLFWLLPDNGTHPAQPAVTAAPATASQPAQPEATQAKPVQTPLEMARLEKIREEGESLAREIVRRQVELEDRGVSMWAADAFEAAELALTEAETAFRESRFQDALAGYRGVIETLSAISESIAAEKSARIKAGEQALEDGNPQAALEAFTVASALDPEDPDIDAGLKRAENLDEVLRLVRQGASLEQQKDFREALKKYQQARRLDSEWPAAGEGVRRMNSEIREQDFRAAMSAGYQAIQSREYPEAREAFARAAGIKPDSTEPDEGLQQVEQSEKNDIINVHRQIAEQHMKNEAWADAIDEFQAALAVTDTLAFARDGLAEARMRLELIEGMTAFLQDPTLLQEDAGLDAARKLLRDAARAGFTGAETLAQVDNLAKLISTARVKIPVTIVSDGNTNVTVRKHAVLGKIRSEVVYLVPGRYTITGDRSGYYDVREELILLAGEPAPTITIESNRRVP